MSKLFSDRRLIIIFLICFIYWGYLFFASQMDISMDALSYESIGRMIYQQGWVEFLKNGPNREPIYPALVAFAMALADKLSVSYMSIQKILQILILFCTQILTLIVLQKLNVRKSISYLTMLYMGISPAMINSTFSLYSEIASYLFVVDCVLLNIFIWEKFKSSSLSKIFGWSIISGIFYLLATFAKGAFVFVMFGFLLVYALAGIFQKRYFMKTAIYVLGTFVVFQAFFIPYKWLNKKYNGNYVYTTRFEPLFYANADKRTRPLTKRILLSHLASIPGEKVCRRFFTESECDYTGLRAQDDIAGLELPKYLNGLTNDEARAKSMALALEKIKQKPFQYLLFMAFDGLRMFFWESTQIGFVRYPLWLEHLYGSGLFKNGLRFAVSCITFWAVGYLIFYVFGNRRKIFTGEEGDRVYLLNFFMLLLMFLFIAGYAVMTILTRYALPIVPLYLIAIAFAVDRTIGVRR